MRLLVCGSRGWADEDIIREHIGRYPDDTTIVHGAAPGADSIASRCARSRGLPTEPHPADWGTYGKAAGYIRNREMLESGVDKVLAFWDGSSRGTKMMIDLAKAAGVEVEVVLGEPADVGF